MMKGLHRFLTAAVLVTTLLGAGEVLFAQVEWEEGATDSFYYFDFHFFRRYDKLSMTLRRIGEHCYVWTDDAQWAKGRYVTPEGAVTDSIIDPDSIRIDMEDVETIVEAFDERTPAADPEAGGLLSDTSGIYDKLTGFFGMPPDVDNDTMIYIMIIDCTEDIGYAAMPGYFDPVNELTPIDNPSSNYKEIIYHDCTPYDPSSTLGLGSIAQQLTHLIQYRNDREEDCWITEGLTYFAQFLCGYGVANEGHTYSRNYLKVYLQSLMTNCREQPEIQDQVKTAMLTQYIFEQYGLDVIQTLATDRNNSGSDGLTAALAAHGFSAVDFDSLFFDEQLAWFMDVCKEDFFDGKYCFRYYESGAMLDAKTYTTWCKLDYPPYYYPGNQWSMDWILANPPAPCIGDTIVFKGDVGHHYRVTAVKANLEWQMAFRADKFISMEPVVLDGKNRGTIDVSGYGQDYTMVYVSIMHQDARDGSETSRPLFLVDNDLTPPDTLRLGLLQNPLAERYLNIYIAANESLFVDTYLDQRPLLEVVRDGDADTLMDIDKFTTIRGDETTHWRNTIIYLREYPLPGEGDFQIRVHGWDMVGNEAPADEISGAVKIASAGRSAALASDDGVASLEVPAGAFNRDTYVILFPVHPFLPGDEGGAVGKRLAGAGLCTPGPESGRVVGCPYQVGPAGRTLLREARLTLRYAEEDLAGMEESQLAVWRLDGGQWVCVQSEVDPQGNAVSASIDRFGQFQLATSLRAGGTMVPETYTLLQNYPNPFNPATEIEYGIPSVQGQTPVAVTLHVYNVLGQRIATLVDGLRGPGHYSVQWDGRDGHGQAAPSGIYFYTIVAGPFESTRTMVLLK